MKLKTRLEEYFQQQLNYIQIYKDIPYAQEMHLNYAFGAFNFSYANCTNPVILSQLTDLWIEWQEKMIQAIEEGEIENER